MKILVLDNYDSFTHNLAQYLGELGADPDVVRADAISTAEADTGGYDRLVISPGPGRPEDAGNSIEFIRHFAGHLPILGVCLGHQAIVAAFGGEVDPAPEPRHGKTSQIRHDGRGVFAGLSDPFRATRYHSLAAITLPDDLEACAWSEDGVVQGVRHRRLDIHGVQFHPESVMTTEGKALLANFLQSEAIVASR
ncbi:MAG TPA: aminodeoxychorismate/anthranilate synthase component II [Acidimicrobiia bacterium]|nr:aminodeoxychorismate/anthranilate synthase component II [Acidimicrobiia bacterium]